MISLDNILIYYIKKFARMPQTLNHIYPVLIYYISVFDFVVVVCIKSY